jgi:hypothetical protein
LRVLLRLRLRGGERARAEQRHVPSIGDCTNHEVVAGREPRSPLREAREVLEALVAEPSWRVGRVAAIETCRHRRF